MSCPDFAWYTIGDGSRQYNPICQQYRATPGYTPPYVPPTFNPAPPSVAPNFPPTFAAAPPYFPPYFPPTFQPKPVLPDFKPMAPSTTTKSVKVAPSDIIQFDDESVEIALIQELLYEDIGATELVNISRTDLIDGQEVIYSPIANLSVIRREYNPNNLIASSALSDYFTRFGINLISRGIYEPYFDDNGDLVIEVDTVQAGEEIQVQILSNGTINVVEQT
jgi:hypothetical protein